jgi:hypothetical protein
MPAEAMVPEIRDAYGRLYMLGRVMEGGAPVAMMPGTITIR